MKEFKIAVALTEEQYNTMKPKCSWLENSELTTKKLETPDDNYVIITGDWIQLGDDYEEFVREVERQRHAILTISDEGEIWKDVESEDENGCDEIFEEIFGWTASICLWEDPSQTLV